MAGLSSSGFTIKTLTEILAEIEAAQKAALGPALNTQADSVVGQLNGIFAAKLAELWEVAQAVYASQYPDSATGVALDNVSAITGTTRLPATKSTVTLRCSGTNGTVLPVGRQVSSVPAGDLFQSTAEGTISGGFVDVPFESVVTGPVIANAGTLTVIETPVSGWTSVTNLADATPGRDIETDASLRVRRALALSAAGDATTEAIRSEVAAVEDVTEVYVYANETDDEDADGVPPHAIEAVVRGGTDQDIIDAIFRSKAAGILAHGSTSGTATDSQGDTHPISFSRPVDQAVELEVEVLTDPLLFPSTGEQQIKDALAAFFDDFVIGQDVVRNKLFEPVFEVPGVIDVTTLTIAFAGDAQGTVSLPVSPRELATLDTANITVTVTT